jgi:hypothetical protein
MRGIILSINRDHLNILIYKTLSKNGYVENDCVIFKISIKN